MLKRGYLELCSIPTGVSVATVLKVSYRLQMVPTIYHTKVDVNSRLEAMATRAGCQGHFGPHNWHTLVGHLTSGTSRARWPVVLRARGHPISAQCQSSSLGKQHSHSDSEGNLHCSLHKASVKLLASVSKNALGAGLVFIVRLRQ